jgi:hypothetical protein
MWNKLCTWCKDKLDEMLDPFMEMSLNSWLVVGLMFVMEFSIVGFMLFIVLSKAVR